jgi:hypothetical protein
MKVKQNRKLSIALLLLGISCGLYSTLAHCLDATLAAKYQSALVKGVCDDGGQWMRCYKLDPLQCDSINGAIIGSCFDKVVAGRSQPVRNESDASVVSDLLAECIRTSFKSKYGANKISSTECDSVY